MAGHSKKAKGFVTTGVSAGSMFYTDLKDSKSRLTAMLSLKRLEKAYPDLALILVESGLIGVLQINRVISPADHHVYSLRSATGPVILNLCKLL
jgi:hypothetical protein